MSGWIGVDLDGTLAEYHGWGDGSIGKPIPAMLKRVTAWLAEGIEVRIFTARANPDGRLTEEHAQQVKAIQAWCLEHVGMVLEITATKDFQMICLYDDRCVQIELNTGRRIDGKE